MGLIPGAALLLQALLNFGLVIAAVSSALQEAKKPGLASDHHRRVDLQAEFRSNLKLSRQLLYKTRTLTRQYVRLLLFSSLGYELADCTFLKKHILKTSTIGSLFSLNTTGK